MLLLFFFGGGGGGGGQFSTSSCISSCTFFSQVHFRALRSEAMERLTSCGIPTASLDCLENLFDEESSYMHPFSEVDTVHKQLAFYRNHFNLIVCTLLKLALLDYKNLTSFHGC